jgi:hypothetical protein
MITPEFVMQKLAEPFDARDVAKPLKDEPLTRPLYNEYMRDSRKPKAPALPPRVQMQVGTPTLNQQRMDQDVASFGERLGVNSAGGSALGQKMNEDLSVQHTKAADEEVADARKKRKITTATVNGVVGRGRGRGGTPLQQVGNAVTAAAPGVSQPPTPGVSQPPTPTQATAPGKGTLKRFFGDLVESVTPERMQTEIDSMQLKKRKTLQDELAERKSQGEIVEQPSYLSDRIRQSGKYPRIWSHGFGVPVGMISEGATELVSNMPDTGRYVVGHLRDFGNWLMSPVER